MALVVCAAGLIAVHLFYPAPRDALQNAGTSMLVLMFSIIGLSRSWRDGHADLPILVAYVVIFLYAAVCVWIWIVDPHRVILWLLNPPFVGIILLLMVVLGTRPREPWIV